MSINFLELEKRYWKAVKEHDDETATALTIFFRAMYGEPESRERDSGIHDKRPEADSKKREEATASGPKSES